MAREGKRAGWVCAVRVAHSLFLVRAALKESVSGELLLEDMVLVVVENWVSGIAGLWWVREVGFMWLLRPRIEWEIGLGRGRSLERLMVREMGSGWWQRADSGSGRFRRRQDSDGHIPGVAMAGEMN